MVALGRLIHGIQEGEVVLDQLEAVAQALLAHFQLATAGQD
jgi:hypothetical protein